MTSETDNRYHVEVFNPPPGHDNRTEVYSSWSGSKKHIVYPPQEPEGAHRAQTMADSVEIEVDVVRMTEKAYLVKAWDTDNKEVEVWIPKSQVVETDCLAPGDSGTMEMSRWIALQKDLIEDEDD